MSDPQPKRRPIPSQVTAPEEPPQFSPTFRWPPGLVLTLDWAELWVVD